MANSSSWIRLSGLSLMVSSSHITRPLTSQSLESLRTHLPHMFADTDARLRAELYSTLQNLINRMRAVSAALARSSRNKSQTVTQSPATCVSFQSSSEELQQHQAFIQWLHCLASAELHSCASYQRHTSGLVVIEMLLKSGVDTSIPVDKLHKHARGDVSWPFNFQVITTLQSRALFDLLLDPFEDIRYTAMNILELRFGTIADPIDSDFQNHLRTEETQLILSTIKAGSESMSLDGLNAVLSRSQSRMLHTGRVDYGDGFARLFTLACDLHRNLSIGDSQTLPNQSSVASVVNSMDYLLNQLEKSLEIAEFKIEAAVDGNPLHGYLVALRSVFGN